MISVDFIHKDIKVWLRSDIDEAKLFSISDEFIAGAGNKGGKGFSLEESDKSLCLQVVETCFYNNIVEFPRGMKIGESSKQEVLDSYPPDSVGFLVTAGEDGKSEVIFHYNFRDENDKLPDWYSCYVTYYFDENEILYEISIGWIPVD